MDIVIIGHGNVASHLATVLFQNGHRILQVVGRDKERAQPLATRVNADAIHHVDRISKDADLILLAVPDDVIVEQYSEAIHSIPIAHTSGSVALSALSNHKTRGVFYPLQTFSKNREANFSEIPICIESDDEAFKNTLIGLGESISEAVYEVDSEKRKHLHLSAVFACNFVNFLYSSAKELLDKEGLSFDFLKPLLRETAFKAIDLSPENAQTGPAIRNDQTVIQAHLELLTKHAELKQLYNQLTQLIFDKHK